MNNIEKLNQLVEKWADTDPQNINKMDEIQKRIVEIRNKIADYPVELIKISKKNRRTKKTRRIHGQLHNSRRILKNMRPIQHKIQ